VVAVEQDFHFADRIQCGDVGKDIGAALIITYDAVHGKNIGPRERARNVRSSGTVRAASRILVGLILHTRDGAQHRNDLPPARGQIGELVGGEPCRMLGAVSLHMRRFPRHADRLRHFAELHHQISESHSLVGAHHNFAAFVSLEAGMLNAQPVSTGLKCDYREGADFIGHSATRLGSGGARGNHFGRGDRLAGGVYVTVPAIVPVTVIWAWIDVNEMAARMASCASRKVFFFMDVTSKEIPKARGATHF
jgi:hypothetical protein